MAAVVDLLTRSHLRRQMGALPVLYALLEVLQVRKAINRHCPTRAEVDHGTVAVVMVLNRLMAPRPLYRIADWLARTVLVYQLGIPAEKFNDDRLARTLDAISQHTRDIWQDVVHQALLRADVDLSVIFYDLTAFVLHGSYADSKHVSFGFAHNTPMNKRKFKASLDVAADGNIPAEYGLWVGRTADMATVQENMDRLCHLLRDHGWSVQETVIIGDRANLNDELAIAYDDRGLRYLAGLQPQKKAHRELLVDYPDKQFYAQPLNNERGRKGYWGRPCQVTFKHEGRQVTHRGLVVLSGPMRSALRKGRATKLRALRQELKQVQTKIGRPYHRTVEAVQCDVPLEILLGVGRFDAQQLKESPNGDDHDHETDHRNTFSTWSYESDQPFSLEALREMVKKRLPANIYRCKGVIYTTDYPERRTVLQVVGRRADVALGEAWGETMPSTQIVAIGAPGSIDPEALTAQFNACISQTVAVGAG